MRQHQILIFWGKGSLTLPQTPNAFNTLNFKMTPRLWAHPHIENPRIWLPWKHLTVGHFNFDLLTYLLTYLFAVDVDSLPGQAAEPAGPGHGGHGDSTGRREARAKGGDSHGDWQPDAENGVQFQRQCLLLRLGGLGSTQTHQRWDFVLRYVTQNTESIVVVVVV